MDMDYNNNSMQMAQDPGMMMPGGTQAPIIEPMQQRIINRTIVHEVPHIQPINTRIINHHIYRHTYSPSYTCTEENEVCNVNVCEPIAA